jgi:transcriptional regulator with XRE-family HTH domain
MITARNMSTLGTYLKSELDARGWSRRYAAERFGMPFSTLNGLVNDRSDPDLATLRQLARGLGVGIARLLQAMNEPGVGAELPRPLRGLSNDRLAYIDRMDDEEFAEFLDTWRKMRGG